MTALSHRICFCPLLLRKLVYSNGRSWPEAAIGFAENHANRIAALRAEAAIGPTELSIAAFDPKPLLVNVGNLRRLLAIRCEHTVEAGELI